ncbi:hypothetical protein ACFQ0R_05190 [Psychroflexus salinarum]|uniref:Chain length determinant protein n=1 Tax=Psychroflexus salinarum TaxID=546024 RepID=A0ABW3GU67_9FLAO
MQNHQTQSSSDEIDLGVVFEKIRSIFKSILIGIVQIFQFLWKHKFQLIVLAVLGLVLQFYLSKQLNKIYTNEYLVKTNYESTEYLYSKVKSINTKLKSEDSLYLKDVFGKQYERVDELEVVPVVDVYNLVNSSEENMETFELLLDEYGGISFLEEEININEYPTHKLRVYIKGQDDNESIANNLYTFLSNNTYYNNLKQITLESYKEQLYENKAIRTQIDSIVQEQKSSGTSPKLDNSGVTFTVSQDLNELLVQKKELLSNDLFLRNRISSEDEVLKIIDSSFRVLSKKHNISLFVIPISLLILYSFFFFFKYLSRNISRFVKKD